MPRAWGGRLAPSVSASPQPAQSWGAIALSLARTSAPPRCSVSTHTPLQGHLPVGGSHLHHPGWGRSPVRKANSLVNLPNGP